MRDEVPIWFSRRDVDLPAPDELMPVSQNLITPDLALVFGIAATPNSTSNYYHQNHNLPLSFSRSLSHPQFQHQQLVEYDLSDLGRRDEQARASKRPRLSWTLELHKRFLDAIAHLGINNAVPKMIMRLMNVEGLTREKIASHLQKYRLYLKSRQELSSTGGSEPVSAADSAMSQLFASTPVPHHFLNHRQPSSVEPATQPFVTSAGVMQHQQTVTVAQQQQCCHHRHSERHGSRPNLMFDPGFPTSHPQLVLHRSIRSGGIPVVQLPSVGSQMEEMETDVSSGGRRILTLFPTNDD